MLMLSNKRKKRKKKDLNLLKLKHKLIEWSSLICDFLNNANLILDTEVSYANFSIKVDKV